ncbi:MAG TPA: nuclear transport factor 2 family protein [Actinomycetota bacterium]|nr:nuclear transport factor 2 family protein [Actinomycetota bacterium]
MEGLESWVSRLVDATNGHDLDALVACFDEGYVNECPVHPARNFTGREQVRRNWEQIFKHVPDIHATVLHEAYGPGTAWTEWEMRGTRADGGEHLMRGVVIFQVAGEQATSCRFYVEPVDAGTMTVGEAVAALVVGQ